MASKYLTGRDVEFAAATADAAAAFKAQLAKTERLRALRMARDEAGTTAADEPAPKSLATKKPRRTVKPR